MSGSGRKRWRALRVVVIVAGALAVAALLAVAAGAVWVRTGAGQAFVRRQIAGVLSEGVRGEVAIGRISGSVVSGVRLHEVRWTGPDGRNVATVDEVSLRYRLLGLLFGAPQLERVVVEAPVVDLGGRRLDGLWADRPGGGGAGPSVDELVVRDAVVLLRDQRVVVERFSAELAGEAVRGAEAQVRAGDASVRVRGAYDGERLYAEIAEARVPITDRGESLRISGTIAGPLQALAIDLDGTLGEGTIALRGTANARRRTVHLDARVAEVAIGRGASALSGSVLLDAQLEDRGLVGAAAVREAQGRVRGVPFSAGVLDARLEGRRADVTRFAAEIPGGKLAGKGVAAIDGAVDADFVVRVDDAGALPKTALPQQLVVALASTLSGGPVLTGSLEREPGGEVSFEVDLMAPGQRVAEGLKDVLRRTF